MNGDFPNAYGWPHCHAEPVHLWGERTDGLIVCGVHYDEFLIQPPPKVPDAAPDGQATMEVWMK